MARKASILRNMLMAMISVNIDDFRFSYRAGGIAISNNKVLLNRGVDKDYWFIPGGRIERGFRLLCG